MAISVPEQYDHGVKRCYIRYIFLTSTFTPTGFMLVGPKINIIITICVAMPSLTAIRWVGQNSGHIFRRLWTKVHRINNACSEVSIVCNAVFRLTMSCCVQEIFANKSRSCPKSRRNFDVLGLPNFGGGEVYRISDRIFTMRCTQC